MEPRTRKRVRVADYEYNDEVAERSIKRIKQEKEIKQEIKNEPKIKQEPGTVAIKKESKITIKSEIKSEVKIELKQEKKEKIEIKRDPGATEEATDQAEEASDNEASEDIIDPLDFPESDQSEEDEEDFADEEENSEDDEDDDNEGSVDESLRLGECKNCYNFDNFKTILRSNDAVLWSNAADQKQARVNNKIIKRILTFSETPMEIMIWARVSKSTSNLVNGAQYLWQILFRKQNWKLPHEIRNKNFKFATSERRIPPLKIGKIQVDWFNEFKRNYHITKLIKKEIKEITKILAKKGEESNEEEQINEEALSEWEEGNDCYLPNDVREYYKASPFPNIVLEDLEEIHMCTPEMSLFSLYRRKRDKKDEIGKPDKHALAKLLDLPKDKIRDDISGILYISPVGRQGDIVYVPYVNMMYMTYPDDDLVIFTEEGSLLQKLMLEKEKLKQNGKSRY